MITQKVEIDVQAARDWLDRKGFRDVFIDWEADSILGLDKDDIIAKVPGENGLKLWGFLNIARHSTGNFYHLHFLFS